MSTTSANAINTPFVDPKTGHVTWVWLQIIRVWQQQLAAGFDTGGNLKSNMLPSIGIVGRGGNIGTILQYIADNGAILSSGLPNATDTNKGAVFVPPGAANVLGTAALQQVSAFDPAGSAAAAQTNANTFASAAANAAQANSHAYTDTAILTAFAPGLSLTITTAPLTVGGTTGTMTFTHGLLTAQVAAT